MTDHPPPRTQSWAAWFELHLPIILYGWFFFGMVLCGFLAPEHRVRELESSLVTKGWHLSLLALLLGSPGVIGYWLRMSGRWPVGPAATTPETRQA